jgi:hypothetical protein
MPRFSVIVCRFVVIPSLARSLMSTRDDTYSPLADEMRAFLRSQIHEKGWSAARVAHEMNECGFNWTVPVVTGAARIDRGRAITIDEYVALCAIFRRSGQRALDEVEQMIGVLNGKARKRP